MKPDPLQDYEQFLSQFPLSNYAKGSELISPDDKLECAFFLESGTVCKYDMTKYGEKVTLNVFSTRTLLPLSWILNGTPNKCHFQATSDVTVRKIPVKDAVNYLKTNPELLYTKLQRVYAGLENTQRRVVYLMRGNLRSRVLFELLIEARRAGEVNVDGSIRITINESELAERAGLSRETISRELAKVFKTSDLCQRRGRSIIIQSLDALDDMIQKLT